nr:unnamed protein product [Naegleria fowleri]
MLNTTIGDRILFNIGFENSKSLFSKNLTIIDPPQMSTFQILGFYPSTGVALTTNYTMTISPISTLGIFAPMSPFSYAFGFYKPWGDENYIRVTDFVTPVTDSTPISKTFPLPFLGDNLAVKKDVNVVIFVRDHAGNIYPTKTIFTSQVSANVDLLLQNPTTEQLILMAHDTSQNYSSMLDKVLVTFQNYDVTLPVLHRALTASVDISRNRLKKVTFNLMSTLDDIIQEQQQEVSQFGYVRTKTFDKSQLMLNIISHMMISFNETEIVRERFTSLLSQQLIAQPQTNESRLIPSLVLNSPHVNVTLSKVIVDSSVDKTTIENNDLGDISLSLKNTNQVPIPNGPRMIGLSFVSLVMTEPFLLIQNNSKSLSNIYDFKYYENDQLVILQNLQSPIVLKFKTMENVTTSSQPTSIACKYWDEVNRIWSSNGCQYAGFDSATSMITCQCSHTTKFSTFLEINVTAIIENSDGVTLSNIISLFSAQIAFGSFFILCCITIFILLIILHKHQPVKSRLVTPYLGILALFIESVLIYVTHRSLIVSKLTGTISNIDENSDASYFNHIATIIVNTLNLTAIFSYLLQVTRIQFMQYLYRKLQSNYHQHNSKKNHFSFECYESSLRKFSFSH